MYENGGLAATGIALATVLLAGCAPSEPVTSTLEPVAESPSELPAATATIKPEPVAEIEADGAVDPTNWCKQWWERVVEADNESSAAWAAASAALDGVDVDSQIISSRSADILDGGDAAKIEQAVSDIRLACAIYIVSAS